MFISFRKNILIMDKRLKQDDAVIKALDLKVIRRLICKTDKGELELVIRKGESNYFLTLDSVPLPKQENKELMGILFPVAEIPQVNNKEPIVKLDNEATLNTKTGEIVTKAKNKGGRPKKVK